MRWIRADYMDGGGGVGNAREAPSARTARVTNNVTSLDYRHRFGYIPLRIKLAQKDAVR